MKFATSAKALPPFKLLLVASLALGAAASLPAQEVSPATELSAPPPRDLFTWPFSQTSIWNMPIGSQAQYVPANLPAVPGNDIWAPMPYSDDEIIILKPEAPLTPVYYSSAGWSGASRCDPTGQLLLNVPIPTGYVVGKNTNTNAAAVVLQADRRTLVHMQPFARCNAGGSATSYVTFKPVDIYGDGQSGAHGGSGLSVIGGSIRVGELRPNKQAPRHALKVNLFARQSLYHCDRYVDCFRWPATNADSYAVGFYGNIGNNSNDAMKMGALLAIPEWRAIDSLGLETEPGRQLAWTLQNYGAYVVEDTYEPAFGIAIENGPDGSLAKQFEADYGVAFEQRANSNTPWSRDVQKLTQALYVVNNNSPTSIGGGGTPRQPLAPFLQ